MSILMTVLLAATPGPCFEANDTTPGWKQVAIPSDAPSLAVVEEVEQFRSDDPITLIEDTNDVFRAGDSHFPGVTQFDFTLQPGTRKLALVFAGPLRGAKVDVSAQGAVGTMLLERERRVPGQELSIDLAQNEVWSVTVKVNDHLRKAPVLKRWTMTRQLSMGQLGASGAYQLRHSLYYRQPAGPALRLCNDPTRVLSLSHRWVEQDAPSAVTLRRVTGSSK